MMKSKWTSFLRVAMYGSVLASFLLLQGCATGNCPVDWLNWPYNTPADEPMIDSSDDYSPDSVLLPPIAYGDDLGDDFSSSSYTPDLSSDFSSTDGSDQTYTIQKGDTLSSVASMYGTTWKKLSSYNNLSNPNKLKVGQDIRIPGSLSASAPVVRSSSSSSSSSYSSSSRSSIQQGTSYVIQRGDTLSGIAKRAGVSVSELKAANALSGSQIIAGKSMSIPRKGEVSAPVVDVPTYAPALAPLSIASEPAPMVDIPMVAPVVEEVVPLAPVAAPPTYEHVFYPGETLEDIARQYGSSQEEIMILNGITTPEEVRPGTKLMIPMPE